MIGSSVPVFSGTYENDLGLALGVENLEFSASERCICCNLRLAVKSAALRKEPTTICLNKISVITTHFNQYKDVKEKLFELKRMNNEKDRTVSVENPTYTR